MNVVTYGNPARSFDKWRNRIFGPEKINAYLFFPCSGIK
jgi:hypothetical protein